ncbi:MAG: translation initiation factor IF-2 subunit beta [Candidatus Bathyarchaeota archaeon]|nr:translation initiation factor IF-2 subunit beta [Candidatus Bathyarchaeota archaeon]
MEKDYKSMLDRAYDELPEVLETADRFTVPRADVRSQRRKTYIMNFRFIAKELQRDPQHLMKFLLNETATRGNFDGTRAMFQGRFTRDSIRNLIEIYTNKYVICPVCGRPDTHVIRDKRLSFLQCDACGARSSIGKK